MAAKKKRFNAREMMELAVSVMNESVPEPRADGKASPLVGAVLVQPDGTVDSASRGELRDGDHAEFTLLEPYGKEPHQEADRSRTLEEARGRTGHALRGGEAMRSRLPVETAREVDRATFRATMARFRWEMSASMGIGPRSGPRWPDSGGRSRLLWESGHEHEPSAHRGAHRPTDSTHRGESQPNEIPGQDARPEPLRRPWSAHGHVG